MIGIYSRVSHKTQDNAAQDGELKRWADSQDEPARWYRDKATGTNLDRPGFAKLWQDVEAGRLTAIVVWRLDRLGRTARGLTALFEEIRRRRVNLISLRDGIDLDTPAGRLMANVIASVAQYETEVRGERQRAGIDRRKAAGLPFGPEPGKFKGRRLKVTPEQEATIREQHARGEKIAAIARATGLSRPTVYSILGAS